MSFALFNYNQYQKYLEKEKDIIPQSNLWNGFYPTYPSYPVYPPYPYYPAFESTDKMPIAKSTFVTLPSETIIDISQIIFIMPDSDKWIVFFKNSTIKLALDNADHQFLITILFPSGV